MGKFQELARKRRLLEEKRNSGGKGFEGKIGGSTLVRLAKESQPPKLEHSLGTKVIEATFKEQKLGLQLGSGPGCCGFDVRGFSVGEDGSLSPAETCGLIAPSDILFSVNEVKTEWKTLESICTLVSRTPRPIKLCFRRLPPNSEVVSFEDIMNSSSKRSWFLHFLRIQDASRGELAGLQSFKLRCVIAIDALQHTESSDVAERIRTLYKSFFCATDSPGSANLVPSLPEEVQDRSRRALRAVSTMSVGIDGSYDGAPSDSVLETVQSTLMDVRAEMVKSLETQLDEFSKSHVFHKMGFCSREIGGRELDPEKLLGDPQWRCLFALWLLQGGCTGLLTLWSGLKAAVLRESGTAITSVLGCLKHHFPSDSEELGPQLPGMPIGFVKYSIQLLENATRDSTYEAVALFNVSELLSLVKETLFYEYFPWFLCSSAVLSLLEDHPFPPSFEEMQLSRHVSRVTLPIGASLHRPPYDGMEREKDGPKKSWEDWVLRYEKEERQKQAPNLPFHTVALMESDPAGKAAVEVVVQLLHRTGAEPMDVTDCSYCCHHDDEDGVDIVGINREGEINNIGYFEGSSGLCPNDGIALALEGDESAPRMAPSKLLPDVFRRFISPSDSFVLSLPLEAPDPGVKVHEFVMEGRAVRKAGSARGCRTGEWPVFGMVGSFPRQAAIPRRLRMQMAMGGSTMKKMFTFRYFLLLASRPDFVSMRGRLFEFSEKFAPDGPLPSIEDLAEFVYPPAEVPEICPHSAHWGHELSMQPLFVVFQVSRLLCVLSCLLLEQRVVLVSSHRTLLVRVALALHSLLSPLKWSHVYIPLLPKHLLVMYCWFERPNLKQTYLDCPTPFFMGLPREYSPWRGSNPDLKKVPGGMDEIVWVDLDSGEIEGKPLESARKNFHPSWLPDGPFHAELKEMIHPTLATMDELVPATEPLASPEAEEAVKEKIGSFLGNLLNDVWQNCVVVSEGGVIAVGAHNRAVNDSQEQPATWTPILSFSVPKKEAAVVFEEPTIVMNAPEAERPFLEHFLRTQAVSQFLSLKPWTG